MLCMDSKGLAPIFQQQSVQLFGLSFYVGWATVSTYSIVSGQANTPTVGMSRCSVHFTEHLLCPLLPPPMQPNSWVQQGEKGDWKIMIHKHRFWRWSWDKVEFCSLMGMQIQRVMPAIFIYIYLIIRLKTMKALFFAFRRVIETRTSM